MRYDLPALVRRGRALAWSSSAPGRLLIRARLARSTTHPPPWRHAGRKFPAPSRGRRRAVRFIRRLPVLSLRPSSTTPCAVATMRGWSGRPSWSRPSPIPLSHVGFFCPLVQEFSNINKKSGFLLLHANVTKTGAQMILADYCGVPKVRYSLSLNILSF
jgi:hypothetical protein